MSKIHYVLLLLLLITQAPSYATEGDTINSSQVLSQSANFTCAAWEPIGICIWLTCGPFGCDLDYSVKVKHYIPDAVVSAYKNTGENPWVDVRGYSSPTSFAQDGGSNSEGSSSASEQALRFKNADAIGSAGNLYFMALAASPLYCDPGATAYFPYYLSTIDPSWRDPIVETPLTLINFFRGLRNGLSWFGGIYPRIGFVNQGHDYKAGALNAQRAADIATRNGQPHVYYPMVWSGGDGYWPPGSVTEGDEESHKWQQLVPKGNSSECAIFADINDAAMLTDPYSDRINQSTGYAWNLWRPYRCCEKEGASLIYHSGY